MWLAAAGVALAFALYTQHAWEDFYITFRVSKNLALGNGLVFTPGERVHAFTSPLGVLLPAFASVVTGVSSDGAALWIFRLMCIAAYGGAASLLFAALQRLGSGKLAAWFTVGLLVLESKSLDFTINGMETGFLLLFLAYTFWAMVAKPQRAPLHLGGAWAGLMWTRPDGFIYIALLGGGFLLFDLFTAERAQRFAVFKLLLQAGLVCTVLYAPWFLWAWGYYGSPIPHTVIAKGAVEPGRSIGGFITTFVTLPFRLWTGQTTIEGTLLPTYYQGITWAKPVWYTARLMGAVAVLAWLWPRLRPEIRAASFTFHGAHAYLTYYPYFPFPWYFPATTILAVIVWAGISAHLLGRSPTNPAPASPKLRGALAGVLAIWVLGIEVTHSLNSARQFQLKQKFVDDGNLRRIGEWLGAHAAKTDRVFMEPLGYIGYFSQLRAYDYPGLSSPEMVATRNKVGKGWAIIIHTLLPEWVVLRPHEAQLVAQDIPGLLSDIYEPAQVFDVRRNVPESLHFDANFTVYRRRNPYLSNENIADFQSKFGDAPPIQWVQSKPLRMVHAPGAMTIKVPAGAKELELEYGFVPDAYAGEPKTDGAVFEIVWQDGAATQILHTRTLRPAVEPGDRGLVKFIGPLPPSSGQGRIVLRTAPLDTETKDWTCWGGPLYR